MLELQGKYMAFKKLFDTQSVEDIYYKTTIMCSHEKLNCLSFLIKFYFKRLSIYTSTCFDDDSYLKATIQSQQNQSNIDKDLKLWLTRLLVIDLYYNKTTSN